MAPRPNPSRRRAWGRCHASTVAICPGTPSRFCGQVGAGGTGNAVHNRCHTCISRTQHATAIIQSPAHAVSSCRRPEDSLRLRAAGAVPSTTRWPGHLQRAHRQLLAGRFGIRLIVVAAGLAGGRCRSRLPAVELGATAFASASSALVVPSPSPLSPSPLPPPSPPMPFCHRRPRLSQPRSRGTCIVWSIGVWGCGLWPCGRVVCLWCGVDGRRVAVWPPGLSGFVAVKKHFNHECSIVRAFLPGVTNYIPRPRAAPRARAAKGKWRGERGTGVGERALSQYTAVTCWNLHHIRI